MFNHRSFVIVGAAYFACAAGSVHAQVGLDVEGAARAAGDVTQAGRGIGAAADAGAGISRRIDGPTDPEIGVGVQTALSQELRIAGVRSDVRDGVATLSGTVANEAEKERAERVVRRVEGVTRVRNELEVAGTASARANTASTSLDSTIESRIRSDAQLAVRDIAVSLRGDVVTLTGQVASEAEKRTAGRIAADAAAGAEVRNNLTVRAEQ